MFYNPYLHCVSGGIAGGIAAALTTPFDCIKTVLQNKKEYHKTRILGMSRVSNRCCRLIETRRCKGFLEGLKPRVIFNIPSTAISTAYEMCKEVLIRGKGL